MPPLPRERREERHPPPVRNWAGLTSHRLLRQADRKDQVIRQVRYWSKPSRAMAAPEQSSCLHRAMPEAHLHQLRRM